ncbi:aldehyde dehydrogenase (NADP(+)) [Hydrogenophaga sp. PBL-H3]|uniref:aldehyde dehydrogenase (NADP(+)) n=1 Tax=Hydrogenophaga sp. PBL-H3 TaxID=434010 RepID=UPI00131F9256|nr:aldehyde dehydrogenase (NADP(+)) [Hydrogenophaga sp. PBL-H3]QHE75418.1 aldehyde dehydrogenase (NADP(+)) [Hydrogenophaga sp. PBL-H3]QHE79845.1 aldehyde dehydrogenase (NADP(+)) [Hydrogenophaga sp. PBL-H3]
MNDLQSFDARSGAAHGEPLLASTADDINAAAQAAADAFETWGSSTGAQRAALLDALAAALEADREALVALADVETALGTARLNGELDRTAFQLRRFASIATRGLPFERLDDPAVAGAPPVGHPAMVLQRVPLGPVAMFAASNFPFAFSVLGGDTASAMAAGCPVVVKAHPGHPLLSQRVFALIQNVLKAQGLPAGLIGLVQGAGVEVGVALVRHPLIAAGAFTGSTRGGAALQAEANARPRPIPFYGELGSINPVVALPAALQARGAELATTLAGSIVQGCGQFCTNPGLIVLIDGAEADAFVAQLATALAAQQPHAMLTSGMRRAFDAGVARFVEHGAQPLVQQPGSTQAPGPQLLQVSGAQFLQQSALHDEVFGPSSLVVRAASQAEVLAVLAAVGGSLTVTLWGADAESDDTRALVRGAMAIAGRVLFAGVPTGVAVTAAQQHGGPWPASTAPMTTSVGDAALNRFLRPVSLQDAPAWLLARQGRPC